MYPGLVFRTINGKRGFCFHPAVSFYAPAHIGLSCRQDERMDEAESKLL